jgi:two-component system sensor histidine kinase DesK
VSGVAVTKDGSGAASQIKDGPGPFAIYPWLFIGANSVTDIVHGHARPIWAASALLSVFALLVVLAIWYGFRRGQGDRLATVLLIPLGADVFILAGWFGHGMFSLFPLASTACAVVLPWKRPAWPVLVIVPLAFAGSFLALAHGSSAGDAFSVWYGTVTAGLIISTILRLFASIHELRETREELARAAVSEERLRFARDLHDLLGHTLSVMVIKAQAVRKLIPRDVEVAAEQAADIETIGRDALRQVRQAVTGYRGRGLDAELDGARAALRDAGIELRVRHEDVPLQGETGALLGWAVREGVTNVIRHSGADHCEISVTGRDGSAVLSVRDDGCGGSTAKGNGLHGLTERISGADGRLEAGPADGGGYRMTVILPLRTLPQKEEVS